MFCYSSCEGQVLHQYEMDKEHVRWVGKGCSMQVSAH